MMWLKKPVCIGDVSIKVELAELQVEIVGFGSPATLLPKPIS